MGTKLKMVLVKQLESISFLNTCMLQRTLLVLHGAQQAWV